MLIWAPPNPSLPPSLLPSLPAIKDQLSHHSVFFPLSHTSCILFMAYIFHLYGFIYGGYIYGTWLTALNQLCVSNKSQIYIFLQSYILLGAGDEILISAAGQFVFSCSSPAGRRTLCCVFILQWLLKGCRASGGCTSYCICVCIYFFVSVYLSHAQASINTLEARSLCYVRVCRLPPAGVNMLFRCCY